MKCPCYDCADVEVNPATSTPPGDSEHLGHHRAGVADDPPTRLDDQVGLVITEAAGQRGKDLVPIGRQPGVVTQVSRRQPTT